MIKVLNSQISSPSFPITLKEFKADIKYDHFSVGDEIIIKDNIKISTTTSLNHPDGAVGYRIEYQDKVVSYITDHEHEENVKNEN